MLGIGWAMARSASAADPGGPGPPARPPGAFNARRELTHAFTHALTRAFSVSHSESVRMRRSCYGRTGRLPFLWVGVLARAEEPGKATFENPLQRASLERE